MNSPGIYILDGIGPFFRNLPDGRINWSKIPFAYLENDGALQRTLFPAIRSEFRIICQRAREAGFNALSVDDLAHLFDHPDYPAGLRQRINAYQDEFSALFTIAAEYGLAVYVTTDIMFHHPAIDARCGRRTSRLSRFMAEAMADLFDRFPQVKGIISRIGESDGLDVEGDFHSRLTIRTPRQARKWLRTLLPVFEQYDRTWIFRTWSVGAYRVGDLIWNRDTLRSIFDGISSRHLVLSMKHGESDFFRYLQVNKNLFRGELPRMIEVQARREYEGAGEYPSFIGSEIARFRDALSGQQNLCGMMVWCQTGGWIRFRRRTFLEPAGRWNEINTWCAIRIFKDGLTARAAVESWAAHYAPALDPDKLFRLLTLSSEVVTDLLYVDEFARRKVFFRRLRVPPMLSVYWDHVIVNHSMRQIMRCFVNDGEAVVRRGYDALARIDTMMQLARELGWSTQDFEFMRETCAILAAAREYYFREYTPEIRDRMTAMRAHYRASYPVRYSVHLNFNPVKIKTSRLRWYLGLLLRDKRGYRLIDRVFTIRILSWMYPLWHRFGSRHLPDFSRKQAMGIDTVFK
jgi:hypothetical protein